MCQNENIVIKESEKLMKILFKAVESMQEIDINNLTTELESISMKGGSNDFLEKERKKVKRLVFLLHKYFEDFESKTQDYPLTYEAANDRITIDNEISNMFLYNHIPGSVIVEMYVQMLIEGYNQKIGRYDLNKNVTIQRSLKFLDDDEVKDIDKTYSMEDSANLRIKRRFMNRHTIKEKMKEKWGLDIEEIVQNSDLCNNQYNELCDIIESEIYDVPLFEKRNPLSKEEKLQRKKQKFHLFDLFALTKKTKNGKTIYNMPIGLFNIGGSLQLGTEEYKRVIYSIRLHLLQCIHRINKLDEKNYHLFRMKLEGFYKEIDLKIEDTVLNYLSNHKKASLNPPSFAATKQFNSPPIKDNLFLAFLYGLLKEEYINKFFAYHYIYHNTIDHVEPLNSLQKESFNHLKTCIDFSQKFTYQEIETLLNDVHKSAFLALFPQGTNLNTLFYYTQRLMTGIVNPFSEQISMLQFICLMQCCAWGEKSEITIQHYGLPRGKFSLSLKTIQRSPENYRYYEVFRFLLFIMQKQYWLNLSDRETTNEALKYDLNQREYWLSVIQNWNLRDSV